MMIHRDTDISRETDNYLILIPTHGTSKVGNGGGSAAEMLMLHYRAPRDT